MKIDNSELQQNLSKDSLQKGNILIEFIKNRPEFTSSRLPSLYSDFSFLKNANPEGYQANVSAWKYALQDAIWEGKIAWNNHYLILQYDNKLLTSLYMPNFGIPLGMMETKEDALKNGEWMLLDTFYEKKGIYARASSYVSNLIAWSLQSISGLSRKEKNLDENCVIIKHVEVAANAFLSLVQERTVYSEHIYSLDVLVTCFSDKILSPRILSELDMKIMIYYLSKHKREVSISTDGQVVKLKNKGDAYAVDITETDILISNLKTLLNHLQRLTQTLTKNIIHLDESIKNAIKSKNKTLAMFQLRSKKISECTLNKRLQTLEQIEEMLSKIDEATIHVGILNSMKGGAEVLQCLMKTIGGIENVENIMEKAKTLSSEVDDIGNMLGEINLNDINDIEIEQEFEALFNESKKDAMEDVAIDTINNLMEKMELTIPLSIPSDTNENHEHATKILE